MISFKYLKYSFLFLFFCIKVWAQEIPPISVFSTEDYGAENQNWSISQSSNKYIYVANNKGLLEFNGAKWELYPSPNETIMRSVRCYNDRIYTGFYMDFGFWEKNEFGSLVYTSILKDSSVKMLEDEQIWEISELDGWMIFKSLQRIYLYNLDTKVFKTIEASNNINKLTKLKNTIYFQEFGKGIFIIENGAPKLVSNHSILKENRVVEFFLKDENLMVLTQKKGFYFFENDELKKWEIPVDDFLQNQTIYSALQLKNGNIVLGTISNGFVKIYEDGSLFYQINQDLGLSNNTILSTYEDIDNNIWLGLDNGINIINHKSPFKSFINKTNFWGTIYASVIYNNYLYLGTNQGLYYKKIDSNENFNFIDNTQGQVWNLQVINGALFCSHDTGTYIIKNNKAKIISKIDGAWSLKRINDKTIIQGNYNGLHILFKEDGLWKLRNKIKGFSTSSRYFIVKNNKIFVNHEYKGVFKLEVDKDFRKVNSVVRDLSIDKGLHSSLIEYNKDIFYASKNGVFKYIQESNNFEKDTIYSELIPSEKYLSAKLIFDDNNNKLWAFTKEDIRYFTPGKLSNKPDLKIIPIKGALHLGASGFENLIHLKENKYLIGTSDGYLTVDLNLINEPKDFYVNINKVLNNQIDKPQRLISINKKTSFNNNQNNLEFFYSVSNYNKTSSIKYQYKLEGHNEKWSNLSEKNSFLFENLPQGDYVFRVRGVVDNKLSENVAEYTFKIHNAWYLSNVFIVLYILLALFLLYSMHIASKRYYKKQREDLLEKAQRELELQELENSQKIIKLNNDKLRSDIVNKNRELATSTMSIIKKNEFLNSIKSELIAEGKVNLDKVVKIIDKNLNNTDDWKMFQEAFNNADKNFLKKIKSKHPELTPNDLRLCAYLRLNLSSKEIAPLLNISPRSVEVKRYRLRKKMALPHDANLTNYILEV